MSNKLLYYLKKYKKNSIYFQGFIKTISVFLLSLIILGGLIHFSSYRIIERLINESNALSLQQVIKETDSDIDVSMGMLIELATNEYLPLRLATNLEQKVEFMRQLSIPINVRKFADSVYIHSFESSEIAVTTFFDAGIINISDFEDQGWLTYYNENPPVSNHPLVITNRTLKQIPILSLVMKYPTSGDPAGYVVINIDKRKLFENIMPTENAKYYVLNEKGELIFGDESAYKSEDIEDILNGRKKQKYGMIISNDTSAVTGFNYIKVYNSLPHLKETNKMLYIELIILIVCALFGLFELSVITFRAYNPLLEISDKAAKLLKTKNEKNEIDLINKVVNQILDDKNLIESLYIESTPDILKGLMLRIISGEDFSEEYIFKQLSSFGLQSKDSRFGIIIVRLNGYDVINSEFSNEDLNAIKETTKSIFEAIAVSYIKEDTLMTIVDEFEIVKLKKQSDLLCEEIKDEFNLRIKIGIGSAVDRLIDLSSSYFAALSAMNMAFFTDSSVEDGNLIEKHTESYTYPTAMEWSLSVATKKGDEKAANAIIDDIYKSIPKTSLMASHVTDIFWQLLNGIFVSLTTINIRYEDIMGCSAFDTHQTYKKLDTASDVVNLTKEIVLNITCYIKNKKIVNNDQILEAAKAYIDKNFSDPELSQKQVARTINYSPSYFSLLMKEMLGESFRDYLLKIRMENAIKLLLETKHPISTISTMVGYENLRSFLRVFKTYTGFTPTDYRKQYLDIK